jgi:A/G-specific adenine glycosylase
MTENNISTDWKSFSNSLLAWYSKNKRILPWRDSRDPYSIWISEIMLQQTQVISVIPYYERFLKEFPNLKSLAEAPLEKVLKCWEGLGYYSRARHLHSTAKEVKQKYDGNLPNRSEALVELPGIGNYTACAVASIAFGEPVPVVDGNVWRVFSRILLLEDLPSVGKPKIFKFLKEIIPESTPSTFNQAMMELGALVCVPQNPSCSICPVQNFCKAFHQKKVENYPKKPASKKIPHNLWAVLAAVCHEKILLRKREQTGLWGGLWDLPSVKIRKLSEARNQVQSIMEKLNLKPLGNPLKLNPVNHVLTHFKLTLYPYVAEIENKPAVKGHSWVELKDNPHPIPVPHLKILKNIKL